MKTKLFVASVLAVFAMGAQSAQYKDGSYVGQGDGNASVIQVQVDIKGGKIADVKVLKHDETEMIIAAPIEMMLPEIVANNGVDNVEAVAGATMSSNGIKAAVLDALKKAQ